MDMGLVSFPTKTASLAFNKFNRFYYAEPTRYGQIQISLSRLRLPREIFELPWRCVISQGQVLQDKSKLVIVLCTAYSKAMQLLMQIKGVNQMDFIANLYNSTNHEPPYTYDSPQV